MSQQEQDDPYEDYDEYEDDELYCDRCGELIVDEDYQHIQDPESDPGDVLTVHSDCAAE